MPWSARSLILAALLVTLASIPGRAHAATVDLQGGTLVITGTSGEVVEVTGAGSSIALMSWSTTLDATSAAQTLGFAASTAAGTPSPATLVGVTSIEVNGLDSFRPGDAGFAPDQGVDVAITGLAFSIAAPFDLSGGGPHSFTAACQYANIVVPGYLATGGGNVEIRALGGGEIDLANGSIRPGNGHVVLATDGDVLVDTQTSADRTPSDIVFENGGSLEVVARSTFLVTYAALTTLRASTDVGSLDVSLSTAAGPARIELAAPAGTITLSKLDVKGPFELDTWAASLLIPNGATCGYSSGYNYPPVNLTNESGSIDIGAAGFTCDQGTSILTARGPTSDLVVHGPVVARGLYAYVDRDVVLPDATSQLDGIYTLVVGARRSLLARERPDALVGVEGTFDAATTLDVHTTVTKLQTSWTDGEQLGVVATAGIDVTVLPAAPEDQPTRGSMAIQADDITVRVGLTRLDASLAFDTRSGSPTVLTGLPGGAPPWFGGTLDITPTHGLSLTGTLAGAITVHGDLTVTADGTIQVASDPWRVAGTLAFEAGAHVNALPTATIPPSASAWVTVDSLDLGYALLSFDPATTPFDGDTFVLFALPFGVSTVGQFAGTSSGTYANGALQYTISTTAGDGNDYALTVASGGLVRAPDAGTPDAGDDAAVTVDDGGSDAGLGSDGGLASDAGVDASVPATSASGCRVAGGATNATIWLAFGLALAIRVLVRLRRRPNA